jgi:hypothetical protein
VILVAQKEAFFYHLSWTDFLRSANGAAPLGRGAPGSGAGPGDALCWRRGSATAPRNTKSPHGIEEKHVLFKVKMWKQLRTTTVSMLWPVEWQTQPPQSGRSVNGIGVSRRSDAIKISWARTNERRGLDTRIQLLESLESTSQATHLEDEISLHKHLGENRRRTWKLFRVTNAVVYNQTCTKTRVLRGIARSR